MGKGLVIVLSAVLLLATSALGDCARTSDDQSAGGDTVSMSRVR
ncbi:hypothetical protein AKJ09_02854 [Labilithrix luteola]|uniref:Uncharacterized protein n=1 Tax=Labilithrix luteola TaxID=1391654 RepID=A0A0K1PRL5_9BACT|nr:hypothetical protein [Labilithrix luteola]AKU96190.1 hypothetical protein AKJ09_02854 [Labilithrix luteola]